MSIPLLELEGTAEEIQERRINAPAKPRQLPPQKLRPCLLAPLLLLLCVPAPAQNPRAVQSQVQAQYRRLARALSHKDGNAYRSLHTPDCLFLTPDGQQHSLNEVIDAVTKEGKDSVRIQNLVTKIQSITPQPDGYSATITEQITFRKMDADGTFGAKGKPHTVLLTTSGRDLWQNTTGQWLRHKAQMQAILSLRVDGKLIPKPPLNLMEHPPH